MADQNRVDPYENALRAAREVWVPESPDFARREVLDRLWDRHIAKLLKCGLAVETGWVNLRRPPTYLNHQFLKRDAKGHFLPSKNSADENWSLSSVSPDMKGLK